MGPIKYYPKGHLSELKEHWPVDKPQFIPEDKIPDSMK